MKRKEMIHFRVERGLTQKELGEILGVTSQQISSIELGRTDGSYKFWFRFKNTFEIPDTEIEKYKRLY